MSLHAYNDLVHTQQHENSSGIDINLGNEHLVAWIDQYCRAHPSKTIYSASTALIDDLKTRESFLGYGGGRRQGRCGGIRA